MEGDSIRPPSESDVYATLADRRRRLLLRLLQDFSAPIPTDELTALVCRCEYEDPGSDLEDVVAVSLYHVHLPKLDAVGAVAYDREAGVVRPGPTFGAFVAALDELNAADGPTDGRDRTG